MNSQTKTGRIAGVWFILTFVFSIPAVILYQPLLNHTDYILGSGADNRVFAGAFSVVTLRQDIGGVGAQVGSLDSIGRSLVAFHDWTFLLGPQFCAGIGNGILLGYLMYSSGLVPRRMALLGVIGGPLAFVGGVFVLFGVFDPEAHNYFSSLHLRLLGKRRSVFILRSTVTKSHRH